MAYLPTGGAILGAEGAVSYRLVITLPFYPFMFTDIALFLLLLESLRGDSVISFLFELLSS